MSEKVFISKDDTIDIAAGLVDVDKFGNRSIPTSGPAYQNILTLFSTQNTSLDASNINYTETGTTPTTVKAILESKRSKTDLSYGNRTYTAPVLEIGGGGTYPATISDNGDNVTALYSGYPTEGPPLVYQAQVTPTSVSSIIGYPMYEPVPSTAPASIEISFTSDSLALVSQLSGAGVTSFKDIGTQSATIVSGEADLTNFFSTSNTDLTQTITDTVPATAMRVSTSDSRIYELRTGAADPWDGKLDTTSTADSWIAKSYTTGEFCSYQGKAYIANSNTTSADVPDTSPKWTVAKLSTLFTNGNTLLTSLINSTITTRCQSLDPANSSIEDIVKVLKGIN